MQRQNELCNYFHSAYWLRSIGPAPSDPVLAALRDECVDELIGIAVWSDWPRLRKAANAVLAEHEDRTGLGIRRALS